ncbi:hypothetical protein [Pantoea vagans]|uniref:hypothetical protein n=1 Tax=Pantoea vagans TaxID=470934 RepID=UPI003B02D4DF
MHKSELILLKKTLTADKLENSKLQLTKLTTPIVGSSKADEFTDDVMKFVQSDEFITKLDDKVGDVLPGETEDQFVKRAKSTLLNLLRSKFD